MIAPMIGPGTPTRQHPRLEHATAHLSAPLAVVDLDAFDRNADALARRAGGTPIRVASKSVRCRALLRRVLARPGYAGVLAFTLPEALWLADPAGLDLDDVVVGYPSADLTALARLAGDPLLAARVTLMVDSVEQLDRLDAARTSTGGGAAQPVRVCLDLDASYRPVGRVHVGTRRSPVFTPDDAATLARAVAARPGVRLVGLMAYEGQVAGQADRPRGKAAAAPLIRAMKRRSVAEIAERRGAVVGAVRRVAELEFVNGGGTGSIETTVAEPAVTEVTAGSGLYSPALFDGYDAFRHDPALLFALDVVRRPGPGLVTALGGGWVASGPAGVDRLPVPTYPEGLSLLGLEGAGEVQTPLAGAVADSLRVGDRVWFRHAKAGEVCERVDTLHLVAGDPATVVEQVPTYRGEGLAFL